MPLEQQFEVLQPTLDRLVRASVGVSPRTLTSPRSESPVPLVFGELVQLINGSWMRGSDSMRPSFFWVEDRGNPGSQGSGKGALIIGGGHYCINTPLFDPSLIREGQPVMQGLVAVGGVVRSALVPADGIGFVLGYVLRPAAANGGRLQVLVTLQGFPPIIDPVWLVDESGVTLVDEGGLVVQEQGPAAAPGV